MVESIDSINIEQLREEGKEELLFKEELDFQIYIREKATGKIIEVMQLKNEFLNHETNKPTMLKLEQAAKVIKEAIE